MLIVDDFMKVEGAAIGNYVKVCSSSKVGLCSLLREEEFIDIINIIKEVFPSAEYVNLLNKIQDNEITLQELKEYADCKNKELFIKTLKYWNCEYYLDYNKK